MIVRYMVLAGSHAGGRMSFCSTRCWIRCIGGPRGERLTEPLPPTPSPLREGGAREKQSFPASGRGRQHSGSLPASGEGWGGGSRGAQDGVSVAAARAAVK